MKATSQRRTRRAKRASRLAGLLLTGLMSSSCRPPEPAAQPEGVDTAAAEEQALSIDPTNYPAVVTLEPARPDPAIARGTELSGLVTGLLELGLADIDGLIPQVQGAAVSPGLAGAMREDVERWTLRVAMVEQQGALVLDGQLCTAGGDCTAVSSRAGTRVEPTPGVAELVEAISARMGRGDEAGSLADRQEPQSGDPYAVLLAGRSAATWYGLLPATPDSFLGNKRRDPVARALLVDPDTALGNWVAGRRAMTLEQPDQARARFAQASFARPSSTLLRADEAVALGALGQREAAWYAWKTVLARRPADPRFALSAARAALAADEPARAEALLAELGEPWADVPELLKVRVLAAVAQGQGASADTDALLARWAIADPSDPEPVRQRLLTRAKDGRYPEALALADELATRGAASEGVDVRIALENALEQPDLAAEDADKAGYTELAALLRARAAQDPSARAAALAGLSEPRALAVRAQALLEAGRSDEALTAATSALQASPWLPEALDVRARALEAGGKESEAAATHQRLCEADPGFAGCGAS